MDLSDGVRLIFSSVASNGEDSLSGDPFLGDWLPTTFWSGAATSQEFKNQEASYGR